MQAAQNQSDARYIVQDSYDYGSFRTVYCNRNDYEGACYVNGAGE